MRPLPISHLPLLLLLGALYAVDISPIISAGPFLCRKNSPFPELLLAQDFHNKLQSK